MSREFILSQISYYSRHLGWGCFRERNMIVGLLHYYESELRKINHETLKT